MLVSHAFSSDSDGKQTAVV